MSHTVTVAIPYWRSQLTVRRAVESVLAQTHRDLVCVVINDGDRAMPPWPALADINDRRLIRHDLGRNRGRYFVDAVTAAASEATWWVPHDADDWSEPHRLANLLMAVGDGVDAVFTPFINHFSDGRTVRRPVRSLMPDRRLRYTAHLSGLWRTGFARSLTHPGYRCAYDALMTTAAILTSRVVVADDPSYHRVYRPGSLVTSRTHGKGTPFRQAQKRDLRHLWRRCLAAHDAGDLTSAIADDIAQALAAAVACEADRLRDRIRRSA